MGFLLKIHIFPDIMRLRLCTNIVLNTSINIGENMKPEIIEALALELTKAIITEESKKNPNRVKLTDAYDWVKIYLDSENKIKEAYQKAKPSKPLRAIPLRF